jgi:hypothetical protein
VLRRRLLAGCVALAAVIALASAGGAAAQGDDPQVDPGSPAGTEYELPIDRARDDASGGSDGGSGGSSGAAPLFGEGVEPQRSGSATPSRSGEPATTTPPSRPQQGTRTPEIVRSQADAPDGGGGALVAIGAGAGGVLLVGALAGLLWRRRTTND